MQVEHSYSVSPERLYRVLTDVAYLTERGQRYGGVAAPVIETLPNETVVTTVRQVSSDKLPSVARRYVGDGRLVQIDRWSEPSSDGPPYRASLAVDAGGMPIEITGKHEIRPVSTGCLYVMTVTTNVKVALVGRAIRTGLEGQLKKLLTAEMAFTERWLAEASS
jgi:hypothetical protein